MQGMTARGDLIKGACLVIIMPFSAIDDILEDFLSEYRQKKKSSSTATPPIPKPRSPASYNQNTKSWPNQHHKGEEPPSSQRCEKGEELKGGFSIPELPIGRELILNIVSTWGDRFYVGLTGIEVFTASGEQARIIHVRTTLFSNVLSFGVNHVIIYMLDFC